MQAEHIISQEVNLLSPILEESINDIIKKKEYVSWSTQKRILSTEGANYMGKLYEVDIKGRTVSRDEEVNLFIKEIKKDESDAPVLLIADACSKEKFFYDELSKIYYELQVKANIPENERFKITDSFDSSSPEVILLKNMCKLGFQTPNRTDVVSLKFAQLVIQALAKFHGLSMVLLKKDPEYFDRKLKSMTQPFSFDDNWKKLVHAIVNITTDNVDDEYIQRIKDYIPKIIEKYPVDTRFDEKRICCLCHGDYKISNILVKEVNGEAVEAVPIDYQFLHCGSPVTDFIFIMYTATDAQFRKNHLEDLKDMYHRTLGNFLKYFQMDVEDMYPRKEFDNALQEKRDYCLMITLFFLPILFVSEDDVPDVSRDITHVYFKLNPRFRERIKDSLKEFEEQGLF